MSINENGIPAPSQRRCSQVMKPVYLDFNATTPMDPRVFEAMLPYHLTEFGNAGSRTHIYG